MFYFIFQVLLLFAWCTFTSVYYYSDAFYRTPYGMCIYIYTHTHRNNNNKRLCTKLLYFCVCVCVCIRVYYYMWVQKKGVKLEAFKILSYTYIFVQKLTYMQFSFRNKWKRHMYVYVYVCMHIFKTFKINYKVYLILCMWEVPYTCIWRTKTHIKKF